MSFEDIKGQDSAIGFLKNSILKGRLSHAYLFTGPEGVGKRLSAVNFAKALNCERFPEDSCRHDECASCKNISLSNHPDVFYLAPEKEGSSIGIDRMRDLIKNISLKPYSGRKKVFIVDGAQSLKHEAANAMLKTLEEPPEDSVLVLIAHETGYVLPTIRSRAQTVKFYPMSVRFIKDTLAADHKIGPKDAEVIARFSYGRLGYAIRLASGDFLSVRRSFLKGLAAGNIFENDSGNVSKEDARLQLDIMLTWYRDMIMARANAASSEFINCDMAQEISSLAAGSDLDHIDGLLKQVIMTNSYIDSSANPKLALAALGLAAVRGN